MLRTLLVCGALVVAAGCDGRSLGGRASNRGDAVNVDAGATADAGDARAPRTPQRHRAAGAACPQDRGSGSFALFAGQCSAPPGIEDCHGDSECTAGANGRCNRTVPPIACQSDCSYDDCFDDSACPDRVPCQCREQATDSQPNACVTSSNCRVDGDCGPGGYCSPSVLDDFCFCPSPALCDASDKCYAGNMQVPCACGDACGHGYYCHTASDTCVDDEDCGGQGTCNYDRLAGRWSCSTCQAVP